MWRPRRRTPRNKCRASPPRRSKPTVRNRPNAAVERTGASNGSPARAKLGSDKRESGDHPMISRRTILLRLAIGTVAAMILPAWAASGPIRLLDADNDGTVDLAEAKKAASVLFDKL